METRKNTITRRISKVRVDATVLLRVLPVHCVGWQTDRVIMFPEQCV